MLAAALQQVWRWNSGNPTRRVGRARFGCSSAGGGSEQRFAVGFTRGGCSASRWHQHSITSLCLLPAALPAPGSGREDRTLTSVPAGTPADRFQPGFWLFLREPFIPNKEPRNHPAVKAFPWPFSGGDQRGAGRGRGPPEGSSQRGNSGGEPGVRPEEGAEGPGPGPSRAPPGAARSGGGPGRCGALRGSAGLPLPPLRPGPGPAPARNRMRPHPLPAALGAAPEEGERRGRPGAAPGTGTGTAPGAAPAG